MVWVPNSDLWHFHKTVKHNLWRLPSPFLLLFWCEKKKEHLYSEKWSCVHFEIIKLIVLGLHPVEVLIILDTNFNYALLYQATRVHEEFFLPGEVVIEQGSVVDQLYIVCHGGLVWVLLQTWQSMYLLQLQCKTCIFLW